jgi:phosphatidate cytidylyltransferase
VNNFSQRLILFVFGIPVLIAAILFSPAGHMLLWNVLVIVLSALSGGEAAQLFHGRKLAIRSRASYSLLGAVLPAAAYLEFYLTDTALLIPLMSLTFMLLLLPAAFAGKPESIGAAIAKSQVRLTSFIYPGFFMLFLVKITALPHPELKVFLFIIIIFSNDTFAYLAGRLFGKWSRHPFAVSPNKTLIGFIGGFTGAAGFGLLFLYVLPEALSFAFPFTIPFILLIACTANAGDLIESCFKRAAGVKDSGSIMPGRGGVLDSADSVLFSAPVFYYIVQQVCS